MADGSRLYYLGPVGTYSHEAAWQFATKLWVNPPTLIPEASIGKVINQIAPEIDLTSDFACVPLENSIQGSVTMTWDRLYRILQANGVATSRNSLMKFTKLLDWPGFGIRAVLTLPIAHYLLSNGTIYPESVTHVYSHPQALAQCKDWLESVLPQAKQIAVASTAEAARFVRESAEVTKVAIGSARAGIEYDLQTSASPIQDFDYNFTRFGLLANAPVSFTQAGISRYMTSICLSGVQNQPGGLLKALSPFNQNGLNLTRIESRPVGHELGTYVFYLDVETGSTYLEEDCTHAWKVVLDTLVGDGIDIIHLGSYPILE